MLFSFTQNFVVIFQYLTISAQRASLLTSLRRHFNLSQLISQQYVLVSQILDLFLEFPLPQSIVLLLLADPQLILLDQRLSSHIVLFLCQSAVVLIVLDL